jgi:small subunit ribosomal protein S8
MVNDPIADMLTRIRNALLARHDSVVIPLSKTKISIARILKDEGFINDYSIVKGESHRFIKVGLKYVDNRPIILGIERASKPGMRLYAKRKEIPRVYGGLGIAIVSTSRGIMLGQEAYHRNIGGELLCYVW